MKKKGQYPVTYVAGNGKHRSQQFFESLLSSGAKSEIESEILQYLKADTFRKTDFPIVAGSYSRTILTKGRDGFEAMVARWSHQSATQVHGHPDYILYYLMAGRFGVENFILEEEKLVCTGTHEMSPGDHFKMEGVPGTYDNAIHRITVLEESLSLHIYSDDALKGRCFKEYPEASPFLHQVGITCPPTAAP